MKEIASILLPNGREHIIYASREVPKETSHEQVVVFPDKTEHRIDWRLNLQKMIETSKVIEAGEIIQEEGTYRVPFSNPEIPYAMGVVFADGHVGSYSTDHQMIIDIVDKVLTTPNTFMVDCGDVFDNGIWGGLAYEQLLPPYMQQFTVEDMVKEVGERWACSVLGNHTEWMFEAAGQKPEQIFARMMKGAIFPGMGLLHLEVGDQKYDWALAHKFWGMSKKNIFNVCVNLRQTEYPNADIYTVAHEHIWGHMEEMIDGRKVAYLRPGTAKLRDRYARLHGISKRGQGMGLAVVFRADSHDFEVMPIDEGIKMMKLREELANIK